MWAKNNHVLGRCDYHYKHEPITFGWKEGAAHYHDCNFDTSVWEIARPQSSKEHPTMKPIELYTRAINHSSRAGELIYDPFLGSGTAVIACERVGRICYGCEIAPQYVDVICRRYHRETGIIPTTTDGRPFPV